MWCVALFVLLAGCATTPDREDYVIPGTTNLRVEKIELRNVESFSERDIKQGLATREDDGWRASAWISWLPVIGGERSYYNYFDWQRDVERIRTYYRQRGFFNADVSFSVLTFPERGTVRLIVNVDEGRPVRVSQIDIEGVDLVAANVREQLLNDLPLRIGAIFTELDYETSRSALVGRLQRAGHAYAEVAGRVIVDPRAHTAAIHFFVDAGPVTYFGPVQVVGLEDIEERFIHQALPFDQGQRYSPGVLFEAQQDIYDLGVFGLVTVLPAHESRDVLQDEAASEPQRGEARSSEGTGDATGSDATGSDPATGDAPAGGDDTPVGPSAEQEAPGDATGEEQPPLDTATEPDPAATRRPPPLGVSTFIAAAQTEAEQRARLSEEVPIVIRVKEARPYRVRLGAGVAVEDTRQDVRAIVNLSSRNFLGGLRKLENTTAAGYAWAPSLWRPAGTGNEGFIVASEVRFVQPQFFERLINLRLRARGDRDVREGFTVWNPSVRLSLDRPLWRNILVEAAYSAQYFRYTNVDEGLLDIGSTALGLDFQREFLLEYFEQSIAVDFRNDVLNPTRGPMVRLSVQEAGNYLIGGGFDFLKGLLSAEYYQPFELAMPGVLAIRARLGAAYSVGRDTGVPVQSRLYSGGTDGMRSFGRRRLSLYTPTGEPVPVGGLTQFEAVIEPRFRLIDNLLEIGDLWGALFVDAGTILRGQLLFDTPTNSQGIATFGDIADTLLYGAGIGTWWITPVGPVRLDFAYTLSDIRNDVRFRRCTDPFDYGTDACEFVPLDEDPIQRLISGYSIYISIGHTF